MAGIHPSPPLYVIQPFKVPEAEFQRACEFLSIKDILTAATSCRQLHEWIWKMITCSPNNPSFSAHEIARKLQCVQVSVLFSKLTLAIQQDTDLPLTANASKSVDLEPILTELEKKAGRKIVGSIKIHYSGYLYPAECEKKEADEKSTAASHSSDQTAITVTTSGLITLWKQLPSASLSAKDVVHHANIIPEEYRENDPKVEQIYHFQHILLVKVTVSVNSFIRGCFVACYNLRKYSAGKFANLVYQNRLDQDVVLQQTQEATFWPGHTEGTFFIGHKKEKERSTLSSFYFDKQQGALKLRWNAEVDPEPNHQLDIYAKLTSNDEVVIVPISWGSILDFCRGYGMSVMCARTGKTLRFINLFDGEAFFDGKPVSATWLLGSIIAYQRPNVGKLSLVNIFGKSLPDIKVLGWVTSVTHDIQLVRKKKTYSVKTNQNVTQVECQVINPIAIMTINYRKDIFSKETRQVVLRSDALQPSS